MTNWGLGLWLGGEGENGTGTREMPRSGAVLIIRKGPGVWPVHEIR
jgi:hypothetical protein